MGRNGMGKTTLIRAIMGLIRAARRERDDHRSRHDACAGLYPGGETLHN